MRSERRTVLEKRKREYRTIYEMLFETPRVLVKNIEKVIGSLTASRRLKEARDLQYVMGPDARKRSFGNMKEYVYFVNLKNPKRAYLKYREDENVIYHAQMKGFCNFWIISKDKMDIDGDIILEGYRSDYYTPYAPDHSWEKALENMRKKIENFDPKTYEPKGFIKTHFNETTKWDEKDEALYIYFKYDLRKPVGLAIKECEVLKDELYTWLERLPECCTIATHYYPETLTGYEHYLFMFETDYEDFVIDVLSELPASSSFFKVADRLFARICVPEQYIRDTDLHMDPEKWYFPLLILDLSEKGIVNHEDSAILEYHWAKDL